MADYNRSEAYDLSLFAMPAIKQPDDKTVEEPAKQPNRKSKNRVNSRRDAFVKIAEILGVSLILVVLFAAILFSRVKLAKLERQATETEQLISEAISENTRLTMLLSSAVSCEKVEAYASSVLGMHKLERYQIHYFENRDGDKVVLVNGKTPKTDENADSD